MGFSFSKLFQSRARKDGRETRGRLPTRVPRAVEIYHDLMHTQMCVIKVEADFPEYLGGPDIPRIMKATLSAPRVYRTIEKFGGRPEPQEFDVNERLFEFIGFSLRRTGFRAANKIVLLNSLFETPHLPLYLASLQRPDLLINMLCDVMEECPTTNRLRLIGTLEEQTITGDPYQTKNEKFTESAIYHFLTGRAGADTQDRIDAVVRFLRLYADFKLGEDRLNGQFNFYQLELSDAFFAPLVKDKAFAETLRQEDPALFYAVSQYVLTDSKFDDPSLD